MAFCRYCGRELREGEVCNCRNVNASQSYDNSRTQVNGSQRYMRREEEEDSSFNIDHEKMEQARERLRKAGSTASNLAGEAAGRASQAIAARNAAAKRERSNPGGAYERRMPIVDQCIVATEEEVPIRQYDMAILRTIFPYKRAEGRLQVTNKRVIFRATGKSWLGTHFYENEFDISQIGGVELKKDRRINGWYILAAMGLSGIAMTLSGILFSTLIAKDSAILFFLLMLLVGAGGVALALFVKKFNWLKMAVFEIPAFGCLTYNTMAGYRNRGGSFSFWIFPAILFGLAALVFFFLYVITEDMIIVIKACGSGRVVEIRRKEAFLIWTKGEYTGFSEVLPWKDTETAARELGALINDVKLYGDKAAAKWK